MEISYFFFGIHTIKVLLKRASKKASFKNGKQATVISPRTGNNLVFLKKSRIHAI